MRLQPHTAHSSNPPVLRRRDVLLAGGALVFNAAGANEVIAVQAHREGEAVRVTTEAVVRAPFDVIWGAITDYDRLAEFVPGIVSSRVIERRSNGSLIVAQSGKARLWLFTYLIDVVVQVTEQRPDTLRIKVLRGNLKQLEGAYQLEKIDGKNDEYRLQWSGVIEPALPVPQAISLPLMRGNIAEQFEGMVREIERREARRVAAIKS
jgi:ribosome-associated toxin RatA of RatAB toxin-antitoxin module